MRRFNKLMRPAIIMKHLQPVRLGVFILILFFPIIAIASPANKSISHTPASRTSSPLTPAELYSGELLAYLMEVVLGRAGQPESRAPWRVRAMDEPLDFRRIVKTLTDPEKNRLDYMVLDPNILDLSQVLYHYDERLSLYKGDYGVTSVFPAPQILALRLFILKKINAGEKIHLDAFIEREKELLNDAYRPTEDDLAATGLSNEEMQFLRHVFLSDPAFYRYLTCPFLVKGLEKTGILAAGDLTDRIIGSANHRSLKSGFKEGKHCVNAVKIAFLPSMTKEFLYGEDLPPQFGHGFKPTAFLEEVFSRLKKEILEATRETLKRMISKPPHPPLKASQWLNLWQGILKEFICFYVEDKRPLVIYPDNAAAVIHEICPAADFTVILMGKNVYRAIYFDQGKDAFPAVNRIYVDIMDIKYNQAGEEIETISHFICSRLISRIKILMARFTENGESPSREGPRGFDFF